MVSNDNDEAEVKLQEAQYALDRSIKTMKLARPNDRSDIDRRFAIVITELEKVEAYFAHFVINDNR